MQWKSGELGSLSSAMQLGNDGFSTQKEFINFVLLNNSETKLLNTSFEEFSMTET